MNQQALRSNLQIENPQNFSLPTAAGAILRRMFASHQRVVIKAEFGGGFSGSRVFLVQPRKEGGGPEELAMVVKLAPMGLIEQEWQAYQKQIRGKLSGVAEIRGEPVFDDNWGGLCYPLVGSGLFEIESLISFCRHASLQDIWHVLKKRLFKRMGPIWKSNTPHSAFRFQSSYDALLPINLRIQPTEPPPNAPCHLLQPATVEEQPIKAADYVRLSGFVITEIDRKKKEITLNLSPAPPHPHSPTPALTPDPSPSLPHSPSLPLSYRLRLQAVEEIERYQVNDIIGPIEGVVTATRAELLRALAQDTLGQHVDLTADRLTLPATSATLPNPLILLPDILRTACSVKVGTIHGDLNLENILVDPEARTVRLIDFALARQDHVLHDLLRLETGMLTRLLPKELAAAKLPPETIYDLYVQLHGAALPAGQFGVPESLDPALKKTFVILVTIRQTVREYLSSPDDWGEYYQGLSLYLLGTLKFKNLDQLTKQIAFWAAATAQELQQVRQVTPSYDTIRWLPLAAVLDEGQTPFMAPPRPPYELLGRDELLDDLKQRLIAGGSLALSAFHGLPGVGKTALAIELANDPHLLARFPDGVLWAGLGRQPDTLALLGAWGAALGISSKELGRQTDVRQRAQAIQRTIGLRRMLLVVDDAWQAETALAFKVGGPNCTHLLTTRLPDIAWDFAGDSAQAVHELSQEDGLALLARFVPKVVASQPEEARALVQAAGALPLALILMGRYLQKAARRGQPRRLRKALKRLQQAEERLRLAQPLSPLEQQPSLPAGVSLSLLASIEISDNALDEPARQALRALSLFPPKPNTFSEEAALAVSDASLDALDALADAGLLESSGPERYTLHQAIADYAKLKRSDRTAEERLVTFFVNYVEAHEKEYDALEQETNNVLAALEIASTHRMQNALVQGTNRFYKFLEVRGLYTLAETLLSRAEQAARALDDTTGLVTILLNLGKTGEKRGNYTEAKAYLQEGLTLAEADESGEKISALLRNLGLVAFHRGQYDQAKRYLKRGLARARVLEQREIISPLLTNLGTVEFHGGAYEQAEAYYQEALALARTLGQHESIITLLANLGVVACDRGVYNQAEAYYQEALALARALKHREIISHLLANLGVVASERGTYEQAKAYLQEGLEIARALKHHQKIIYLLWNLGGVACKCGAYEQAEAYLQEGLVLARTIGHLLITSGILVEWGQLYLKQHNLDLATTAFREALEIAQEVGTQEYIAQTLYGLAQVAFAHNNIAEARRQGQESLAIFERIGHRNAAKVKEWLAGLPKAEPLP